MIRQQKSRSASLNKEKLWGAIQRKKNIYFPQFCYILEKKSLKQSQITMHDKLKLAKWLSIKSKHWSQFIEKLNPISKELFQSQTITFQELQKIPTHLGMYAIQTRCTTCITTEATQEAYTRALTTQTKHTRLFCTTEMQEGPLCHATHTYLRINANTWLRCIAALLSNTNFECGKILQNQKQLISSNYARFLKKLQNGLF